MSAAPWLRRRKVFCLHTMLTMQLIEDFLDGCSEAARKQLIFTTHDLLLMDQSQIGRAHV